MYSILFKIDDEVILEENKKLDSPVAELFIVAIKSKDIISSYLGDFPFKDLSQEDIDGYASYLKNNISLDRINHPKLKSIDNAEFAANINIHGLFSLNNFLSELMEEGGLEEFFDYNQANVYMNTENMQVSVYTEIFHHNKRFVLEVNRNS